MTRRFWRTMPTSTWSTRSCDARHRHGQVFGAGQYAIRIWVKPDTLGKLGITVPESSTPCRNRTRSTRPGRSAASPSPQGQEFTYTVRAQGRLVSPEEFGDIVVRANPDGSIVRLKDVARIELGAQNYNIAGRIDGKPAGVMAIYQLPGTNALATVERREKDHGGGQEALSRRTSTTPSPSTPRGRSARASARSSSPSWRRWSW